MSFQITPLTVSIREARAAECTPSVADLRAAAAVFAKRSDFFANGKAETCHDLADKLQRYGSYASPKQQEFAAKLVEWSKPKATAPRVFPLGYPAEALFDVMQRHSTFHVAGLKIQRKNQDSLCWIVDEGEELCIGKIENGRAFFFTQRMQRSAIDENKVRSLIEELNADPLAAAMKYGKLSGRCCSCGRDLTDPASIEAGIGPVCAQKFN